MTVVRVGDCERPANVERRLPGDGDLLEYAMESSSLLTFMMDFLAAAANFCIGGSFSREEVTLISCASSILSFLNSYDSTNCIHHQSIKIAAHTSHTQLMTHTHTHFQVQGLEKGVSENEAPGPVGAYTTTHNDTITLMPNLIHRISFTEHTHTHTHLWPVKFQDIWKISVI